MYQDKTNEGRTTLYSGPYAHCCRLNSSAFDTKSLSLSTSLPQFRVPEQSGFSPHPLFLFSFLIIIAFTSYEIGARRERPVDER